MNETIIEFLYCYSFRAKKCRICLSLIGDIFGSFVVVVVVKFNIKKLMTKSTPIENVKVIENEKATKEMTVREMKKYFFYIYSLSASSDSIQRTNIK